MSNAMKLNWFSWYCEGPHSPSKQPGGCFVLSGERCGHYFDHARQARAEGWGTKSMNCGRIRGFEVTAIKRNGKRIGYAGVMPHGITVYTPRATTWKKLEEQIDQIWELIKSKGAA